MAPEIDKVIDDSQDVIPAGTQLLPETTSKDEGGDKADKGSGDSDESLPERFKGKSKEEIAQSFVELEKTMGSQSAEVGHNRRAVEDLSRNNDALQRQVQNLQATVTQQNQVKQPDFTAEMSEITKAMEDGDMGIAEGNLRIAEITAERTEAQTKQLFAQHEQNQEQVRQNENLAVQADKFVQNNPNFLEAQQSGDLDKIIQSDPLLIFTAQKDVVGARLAAFSRFELAKAKEALKLAQEKGEEKGKAEQAALEEGAKQSKVLQRPGVDVRQTNPKKGNFTREEIRSSAGDALTDFRQRRANGG